MFHYFGLKHKEKRQYPYALYFATKLLIFQCKLSFLMLKKIIFLGGICLYDLCCQKSLTGEKSTNFSYFFVNNFVPLQN
jgi:hypothetical protein